MRIRDWSSAVCSSDLCDRAQDLCDFIGNDGAQASLVQRLAVAPFAHPRGDSGRGGGAEVGRDQRLLKLAKRPFVEFDAGPDKAGEILVQPLRRAGEAARSEEHTSELQSLMRISYAVFCLKKKQDV